MPPARRTLTDAEILSMQLSTSAAKRLRGEWPPEHDRRMDSVAPTAIFLWLVLGLCLVALTGTFLWEALGWAEEHCGDRTHTGAGMECAQGGERKTGGEGEKSRHGAMVRRPSVASYVRGGLL